MFHMYSKDIKNIYIIEFGKTKDEIELKLKAKKYNL
jgi:hypothetical protein